MNTKMSQNKLAKQFIPLVKKICNQYYGKSALEYEELEGYAWLGFTLALNSYDKTKSEMSFESFVAYGIRNAILNGVNTDSRTIAVSYYKQKQMRETGQDLPLALSINTYTENEDKINQLGVENEFTIENTFNVVLSKLREEFNEDYIDIFCSIYGLDGHKIEKNKEIAKRYNVSCCLITKRVKKIIDYIKNNNELSEYLRELL
jgi:RNA polymerase sigma factor (sigma-70 family)